MLILLTIITMFGFGTAINMLVRRWWMATLLYCLFLIYIVVAKFSRVTTMEWILLVIGLIGVILAALGTRALKKRGYALFL